MKRKAIIISLSGFRLKQNEKKLIKTHKPWGIILFKRNIKSFNQAQKLISDIKKPLKIKIILFLSMKKGEMFVD